ncbi:hypothetical protein [Thalassobacter stenotrophicus]|uniref:Uncharacterized protein n=1 Tax=Thalassobacter stenotrophicus DSM 16310 TaxID=1123361 RepID=A0ABY1IHJ6_9RHOB|nr:hypothetical protein [Thalassobacter stenotrophicus]SHJ18362.1 hypothetical protein SAMN02744035_02891 [Thalassobacter stenotrophicus DSM 16310]
MPHIGSSLRITSPNYRGSTTRNLDIYQSRMGDVQADKAYEPEAIMLALLHKPAWGRVSPDPGRI